jgi:hypothetical protein
VNKDEYKMIFRPPSEALINSSISRGATRRTLFKDHVGGIALSSLIQRRTQQALSRLYIVETVSRTGDVSQHHINALPRSDVVEPEADHLLAAFGREKVREQCGLWKNEWRPSHAHDVDIPVWEA